MFSIYNFEGAWEPEQTAGTNTLSQEELKSQMLQVPDLAARREVLNWESNPNLFKRAFAPRLPSALCTRAGPTASLWRRVLDPSSGTQTPTSQERHCSVMKCRSLSELWKSIYSSPLIHSPSTEHNYNVSILFLD